MQEEEQQSVEPQAALPAAARRIYALAALPVLLLWLALLFAAAGWAGAAFHWMRNCW